MAGNNRTRNIILIAGLLVIVAVAAGLYAFFGGESGVASGTITAPTLDVSNRATPAATTEPTEEASAAIIFNILPEESQVSFTLDEELMGSPKTVIGVTDQVAGQILVDFANPSASQIGTIRINVRTLTTDSDMRNRAIRRAILRSDQDEFEFAELTNIEVSNMPEQVTMGQAFSFQVSGDFTLVGTTNRLTFDVSVMPLSETEITGTATTTVQRAMYGLEIPNAPGVANVSEDVVLQLDFTARAG